MALLPIVLDKTDKDFANVLARMRNLIRSVFPKWTEENVANFGNLLIELEAHLADLKAFYIDKWARESRLVSAQLRRSVMAHAKLLAYQPGGATAATVDVRFSLPAPLANPVPIAKGNGVKTPEVTNAIRFEVEDDEELAAGQTSVTLTLENSVRTTEAFIPQQGVPDQTFQLTKAPFLDDSSIVTAGNGAYTQVGNFLDSDSTERHYVESVDALGRCQLRFGNGINGAIPTGTLTVTYKTGGGDIGVLEVGSVRVLEGVYRDSLGNPVALSAENLVKSIGGTNRESNAQIKQNAPRQLRVLSRAVAREDFEIVAELTTGVARALYLTKNEDPAVPENTGRLFIVPIGGGQASPALVTEIGARFAGPTADYPKTNTLNLITQTAPYATVDVTLLAYKRPGVTGAQAKAAVLNALETFFAIQVRASDLLATAPELAASIGVTAADGDALVQNPRVDFGWHFKDADGNPTGELPFSDVYNVVRDVAELRKLGAGQTDFLLNGLRSDVVISNFAFPVLGTVVIIDADTSLPL
jgi:hypothetical protein